MNIVTTEEVLKSLVDQYIEAESKEDFNLADDILENQVKSLAGERFAKETGFSKSAEINNIFSMAIGSSVTDKEKYIDFRIQQLKNSCLNIKKFQYIAEKFVISIKGKPETIKYAKADAHHGGKVPFSCELHDGRRVFVKPRSATLDISIIRLFEDINKVQPDLMLPTYKIENVLNKEIDSVWSVWDAIEGYEPGEGIEIIETGFLENKSLKITGLLDNEMEELKRKLYILDAVARKIHLSDLHGENLIFTNLVKDKPSSNFGSTVLIKENKNKPIGIVPIDLESIQKEAPTGLLNPKSENLIDLNEATLKEIEQFNKTAIEVPFRFVPLPTSGFLDYLDNPDNIPKVIELIEVAMKEKNLFLDEKANLNSFIETCFKNNEVPFFTCKNNIVYPGGQNG